MLQDIVKKIQDGELVGDLYEHYAAALNYITTDEVSAEQHRQAKALAYKELYNHQSVEGPQEQLVGLRAIATELFGALRVLGIVSNDGGYCFCPDFPSPPLEDGVHSPDCVKARAVMERASAYGLGGDSDA